jgi:hypothetical protein
MSTYFEHYERQTQGSTPFKDSDIVEWPGIVVSEGEADEDTLLEMSLQSNWHNAGDVAERLFDAQRRTRHIDRVNKIKDRADEALDAKRVHAGMTLEEFLSR